MAQRAGKQGSAAMNVTFQVEACTNADGGREVVSVECEPTSEEANDDLAAEELGAGTWHFEFVVPASFDGSEPVFRKVGRYGLERDALQEACADAMRAAGLNL
jgi:hypothetical protein